MDPTARTIDFYVDFSSPYSYIASEWIEALAARHGRTVRWKAILLGVTFQAAELRSPVSHPIKREYSLLDFDRSARFAGVPFTLPATFPVPTQNAARVFWWLHESDPPRAAAWGRHCLRATFTRGDVDLSKVADLRAIAAEFGLDADEAEAVWSDPRWKARLKAVCEEAVAQGVFGAPFFVVDGEPFWGNDRRAQIERWLESGPF
jgi:2-hydroxychromene-2-carboxylate isomerase